MYANLTKSNYPSIREKELERIIKDIFWMARRYAHGRHTYVSSIVRDAFYTLRANGIKIERDNTIQPPDKNEISGMNLRSDYLDDLNDKQSLI